MKRLIAVAAAVLWAGTAAADATTSVVGSPHDLSPTGGAITAAGGQAQNQVCVYCHAPHNAVANGAPLWNRANATTSFKMYSSANSATFVLDSSDTNTAARPVGAVSLACLSCHDGQTAFNSLNVAPMFDTDPGKTLSSYTFTSGNATVTTMTDLGAPTPGITNPNFGTDLTNEHPVSFTYDSALATLKNAGTTGGAGGLNDPSSSHTTVNGTGALIIYRGGGAAGGTADSIAAQMLFTEGGKTNQLECGSCHEPHIHGTSAVVGSNFPFLIKSNQNSYLCLTCHNK